VTVDDVLARTGFPLCVEDVVTTRVPTDAELAILRELS
jgi:hypothetical protein